MPRLFVGSFLTDEGIERLARLSAENQQLAETWRAKIRWTRGEKLHITWVFLGEVHSEAIPDLISELQTAIDSLASVLKPLTISYDTIELWPNERQAALAVLTPSSPPNDTFKLVDAVKRAVGKFISPTQKQHEFKTFRPHLTLLRFSDGQRRRSPLPKTSDVIIDKTILPVVHEIRDLHLIESAPGSKSNEYRSLAQFSLDLT
jgi:2'-5' RNA ligase